jgi:hypothetical protein
MGLVKGIYSLLGQLYRYSAVTKGFRKPVSSRVLVASGQGKFAVAPDSGIKPGSGVAEALADVFTPREGGGSREVRKSGFVVFG